MENKLFLLPIFNNQECLKGSLLISAWQPFLETLGEVKPIAELSEHTHHFADLSQGVIKVDQFEEDFNQLEQIQKQNFDLLVKSFLVSFWKLPFDRVESILEFAPLLYLIMSLIGAQEYVAPIEKQDKKNSNVIRWLNKRSLRAKEC